LEELSMDATYYKRPRFRVSGDCSLLVEYGEGIALPLNERVRAMTSLLGERAVKGVKAVVPAYSSLAVIYDPSLVEPQALMERIEKLEAERLAAPTSPPSTVEIPVCYGSDFGPDIPVVAGNTDLSEEQIIALHSSTEYPIYMIGFTPGFCYLGGMDQRLRTPRRKTPRTSVPEGSVGIAESQTGMYPIESPGGWQIIGRTPLRLFAPEGENPFLYKAGDRIRFRPIGRDEFLRISEREKSHEGL
jgi:KipI family sensor histidine kinase inhibitor